jgi:hypothetical protein
VEVKQMRLILWLVMAVFLLAALPDLGRMQAHRAGAADWDDNAPAPAPWLFFPDPFDAPLDRPGMFEGFVRYMTNSMPLLIVYLGGIALAFHLRARAPRGSLLVILGLSTMLLAQVVTNGILGWVVHQTLQDSRRGEMLATLGFARGLLYAIGLSVLVAAAFAGRSLARSTATAGIPSPQEHVPIAPDAPAAEDMGR